MSSLVKDHTGIANTLFFCGKNLKSFCVQSFSHFYNKKLVVLVIIWYLIWVFTVWLCLRNGMPGSQNDLDEQQILLSVWVSSCRIRILAVHFLAHLSRRLIGELIGYPWSVVRPSSVRSQCSKIFFSKTAWPMKAKFYVEPPWAGGTIFC